MCLTNHLGPLCSSITWSCRYWSSLTSVVFDPPYSCLPFSAESVLNSGFYSKGSSPFFSLECHFKVVSADSTAEDQKPHWRTLCRSVTEAGHCSKQQTSWIKWMEKFQPPTVVVFSWFPHSERLGSCLVYALVHCPHNSESWKTLLFHVEAELSTLSKDLEHSHVQPIYDILVWS